MALDFPSSPVDGQTFGSYIWSASKGVWQAREEAAATAIMSPTKPATGNPGDIWINTSTGIAFAYYDDGNTSQWIELLSSAVPNTAETMPVASIIQTARVTAPTGWLLCQGQSLLVADYPALHTAIGYTYGGSGSNFLLPDLRGRVPVGQKTGTFGNLGGTGGAETVALETTHVPSHTHTFSGTTVSDGAHSHTYHLQYYLTGGAGFGQNGQAIVGGDRSGTFPNPGTWNAVPSQSTSQHTGHTHTYSGTTSTGSGSGTAHPNLQPYIVLNYMIKV